MQRNTLLEKNRFIDRIKEITTLIIFIIVIAVISIIVMDILIFPLSKFAINHKNEFNYIIKDVSVFLLLIILIFMFIKKIFKLKNDGFKQAEIIKFLFLRPFQLLFTFFIMLLSTAVVIYLLSLLFHYNNYVFRYLKT